MTLLPVARADFRERSRRYGFVVTLVLTLAGGVLFLPSRDAGYATVDLGGWTGRYTAEWIGAVMALLSALFLSLGGFYVVRGSIARDRTSGVGQILAASPLSSRAYLAGKAFSNFAVLASMTAVLMSASFVMQFVRGEDRGPDILAILAPFLLVTLPVLALTAGLAVLFETLPGLKGSFGNVAWFFFWTFAIVNPFGIGLVIGGGEAPFWLDPSGIALVSGQMIREAMTVVPGYAGQDFSLGGTVRTDPGRLFTWSGLDWSPVRVAGRLAWPAIAALLVMAAVPFFDRFDTVVRPARAGKKKRSAAASEGTADDPQSRAPDVAAGGHRSDARGVADRDDARAESTPSALPALLRVRTAPHSTFFPLVLAELRLLLKGVRPVWLFVTAGLVIGGFAAPAGSGGDLLRGLALILPLPLLSALGCREELSGTASLVLSAPRSTARLLPAQWCAGFLVMFAASAGSGVRAIASGSMESPAAWISGAAFVPALALAAGVWTGNRRLFEALYLALWYIGPMQRVTLLDYIGVTPEAVAARVWIVWAGLAGMLIVAAVAGRRR